MSGRRYCRAVGEILKDHPHFTTPGVPAMELLEFLPMPGM